jgi:hypothetical protein
VSWRALQWWWPSGGLWCAHDTAESVSLGHCPHCPKERPGAHFSQEAFCSFVLPSFWAEEGRGRGPTTAVIVGKVGRQCRGQSTQFIEAEATQNNTKVLLRPTHARLGAPTRTKAAQVNQTRLAQVTLASRDQGRADGAANVPATRRANIFAQDIIAIRAVLFRASLIGSQACPEAGKHAHEPAQREERGPARPHGTTVRHGSRRSWCLALWCSSGPLLGWKALLVMGSRRMPAAHDGWGVCEGHAGADAPVCDGAIASCIFQSIFQSSVETNKTNNRNMN